MQQFMMIGRIGGDIQYYCGEEKVPYARMSVADNTFYRDATGERHQFTSWIPVVGFGGKADFMHKYLKKGMLICLTGEWRNHIFDKDGERRYAMELKLGRTQFCDMKGKADIAGSDDPDGGQEFMDTNTSPFGEDFDMPSYIPDTYGE